tara:strand:+ start:2431 stop:2820 length:390 start_codon:yes stop_codon:yes gene_type:complete
MRDFAALDENNVVVNVIATDDKDIEWCEAFDPSVHKWVFSASENTAKSACIGDTYDESNEVFLRPKPYPSWVLNSDWKWVAPVSPPADTDEKTYAWNEETGQWRQLSDDEVAGNTPIPEFLLIRENPSG